MNRLRLTIANLMIVVLYAGLAFAALRNADKFWASATYTLAILAVSAAVVVAVARKGRAGWRANSPACGYPRCSMGCLGEDGNIAFTATPPLVAPSTGVTRRNPVWRGCDDPTESPTMTYSTPPGGY